MKDIAVRVEKVSKKFQIGRRQPAYKTLRETLADAVLSPFRKTGQLLRGQAAGAASLDETLWALRDISFEIRQGDVVGFIGKNGAGKSTLLKILSRITEPTTGYADIHGRVGSLLEVGTGFHPELTGRENVFLNGAILGMKKTEIKEKFDEIVSFAEVEKFIDTPVKHYSSGMYLRLAFGVAAHLEPEILLVDEVLAVGDAGFQKKCLNKMQDLGEQGRTVIFISHSMPAITRLCNRAVLLEEGRIIKDGPSHEVVSAYLNAYSGTTAHREWSDPSKAPGGAVALLRSVCVRGDDGEICDVFDIRRPVVVEMKFDILQSGYIIMPSFHVYTEEGIHAFSSVGLDERLRRGPLTQGAYVSKARIPGNLLTEGFHFIGFGLVTQEPNIHQYYERDLIAFQIVDSTDGDAARGDYVGKWHGAVRPLLEWTTSPIGKGN